MARIRGVSNYKRSLKALEKDIIEAVQDEMNVSGETIVTNVKNDIRRQGAPGIAMRSAPIDFKEDKQQSPPSGGRSRSGERKPNKKHVPSRPYTPPNADTGWLMASYSSFMPSSGLKVFVGSPVRYARWLEYGTTRMKARPHLIPRYREELPKFKRRLKARIRQIARQNNARKF